MNVDNIAVHIFVGGLRDGPPTAQSQDGPSATAVLGPPRGASGALRLLLSDPRRSPFESACHPSLESSVMLTCSHGGCRLPSPYMEAHPSAALPSMSKMLWSHPRHSGAWTGSAWRWTPPQHFRVTCVPDLGSLLLPVDHSTKSAKHCAAWAEQRPPLLKSDDRDRRKRVQCDATGPRCLDPALCSAPPLRKLHNRLIRAATPGARRRKAWVPLRMGPTRTQCHGAEHRHAKTTPSKARKAEWRN